MNEDSNGERKAEINSAGVRIALPKPPPPPPPPKEG